MGSFQFKVTLTALTMTVQETLHKTKTSKKEKEVHIKEKELVRMGQK